MSDYFVTADYEDNTTCLAWHDDPGSRSLSAPTVFVRHLRLAFNCSFWMRYYLLTWNKGPSRDSQVSALT
jgi:hypothetical protein